MRANFVLCVVRIDLFIPNPPYSPDLVPSYFHFLGCLIDSICGKIFGNNDEVIEEVMM